MENEDTNVTFLEMSDVYFGPDRPISSPKVPICHMYGCHTQNFGYLIDFCHRMTCKCAQLPPIPIINITKCIKKVHLEKRALKHTKFVILAPKTLKQHIFDKILRLIDYFFVCLDNTIQLKEKHSSEGHTGSINTSKPLKTYFFIHFKGEKTVALRPFV